MDILGLELAPAYKEVTLSQWGSKPLSEVVREGVAASKDVRKVGAWSSLF